MQEAMQETDRRREKQIEYNRIHSIIPKTVTKPITNTLVISKKAENEDYRTGKKDIKKEIERLTAQMKRASEQYDFEKAILLRDRIAELKKITNV
jgi:excinuclease ABC subunit B